MTDFLAIVTEKNPVAVVVTNKAGTIEYVNDEMAKSTGYTKSDLIGQNPRLLQSGEHTKEFYNDLWGTIKNGGVWKGTFKNRRKSGENYWEKAVISPLTNNSGTITHFVGIKEDITKQVEAQIELEDYKEKLEYLVEERTNDLRLAKEKAELSDRLKTAFLSNLSHEVRTPLNAIVGFSQMLTTSSSNISNETYFKYINDSAKNLLMLVEDMVDIAKVQTGELELQEVPVNINSIMHNVFQQFWNKTQERKLDLISHTSLPDDSSIYLLDPVRLKQVMYNLIDNAIKFTPKGKIEYGYKLYDKHDKKSLYFFVQDTGIGISKNDQKIIYDTFRQVNIKNTRQYGGNGLGLSLSKAIVEKMGGKLKLESKVNQGSKFYFTIPLSLKYKHNEN